MSQNYYNMCCRYRGQNVRINDKFGNVHSGKIVNVTRSRVFIQPNGPRPAGSFGMGFYRGYGPYSYYPAYGIGLGFITGLAIGGLLFW
ncbi:hypothetical protein GKZ89_01215 [Bacillus mangrovi]|uniref:Uncharacterized protein n=1 Tax=Metabacillus mangrovi TaxID=1491830 RepID=A0A7X2S1F7_9BACI|nr:hypothetical protein [Metabacillus mangrovi]MTH52009.1 hypothetical protein [Metabacillus mangrovi]